MKRLNRQTEKRAPSNTAAAHSQSMRSATANQLLGPINPPEHVALRAGTNDRKFWDAVMRARSREEWGLIELGLAGQLARVMTDIETLQQQLDQDGYTIVTDKGWPAANPAAFALNQATGRQMKLLNALRIAGAVVGETETLKNQRKAERAAENALLKAREGDGFDEESLIPLS